MAFRDYVAMLVTIPASAVILWKLILLFCPWLPSDWKFYTTVIATVRMVKKFGEMVPVRTIIHRLVELAEHNPNNPFILYEDEVWTFKQINDLSNQVARAMYEDGRRMNDTVAIMMTSQPRFVAALFGIAKTGAVSALINFNLRGKSLLQCIEIIDSKILVISKYEEEAVKEIEEELRYLGITIYIFDERCDGEKSKYISLTELCELQSAKNVPSDWTNSVTIKTNLCFIYTSGTTGLPKAVAITHEKGWNLSRWLVFADLTENDVLYTPLPLYHTAGIGIGVFSALYVGCRVVIRRKFSASNFWRDCRRHRVTVIQYIGETIRYVCNQPVDPDDRNHYVRAAIGNGLRAPVWKTFLDRFGKHINVHEFYGATEGNFASISFDNHIGSIGYFSPFSKKIGNLFLAKYSEEDYEPIRDASGRGIEVPDGSPGLALTQITERTMYHGYWRNDAETKKKISRNLRKEGDAYFNTGDIIRRDHDYHLFYVDRLGDTFRWKGENVSTNEVGDVMSVAPSIEEANIFGVEIPGHEGRACMMVAVIREEEVFDCVGVYKYACSNLPPYARPYFIRLTPEMNITGTFKMKKVSLREEGFNPDLEDPIYFLDKKTKRYIVLTEELFQDIMNNGISL